MSDEDYRGFSGLCEWEEKPSCSNMSGAEV